MDEKNNKATPAAKSMPPHKKGNPKAKQSIGKWVLGLLLLASALLNVYVLNRSDVSQKNSNQQRVALSEFRQQLTAAKNTTLNALNNTKKRLTQLTQQSTLSKEQLVSVKVGMSDLQSQLTTIEKTLDKLQNVRQYQSSDWQLAKAYHLLELAQLSLHFDKAIEPTILLLQSADALLKQTNQAKIFPVRQAISDEISALKALPTVDLVGRLSQLSSLAKAVKTLPLNNEQRAAETVNKPQLGDNAPSWQQRLSDVLSPLKQLVTIRKHNLPISPLLSPSERQRLNETIQATLQQAQWASIHQNQAVYQQSLTQTKDYLTDYFLLSDNKTRAFLSTLSTLMQQTVAPKLPDISESSLRLKSFLSSLSAAPIHDIKEQSL